MIQCNIKCLKIIITKMHRVLCESKHKSHFMGHIEYAYIDVLPAELHSLLYLASVVLSSSQLISFAWQ